MLKATDLELLNMPFPEVSLDSRTSVVARWRTRLLKNQKLNSDDIRWLYFEVGCFEDAPNPSVQRVINVLNALELANFDPNWELYCRSLSWKNTWNYKDIYFTTTATPKDDEIKIAVKVKMYTAYSGVDLPEKVVFSFKGPTTVKEVAILDKWVAAKVNALLNLIKESLAEKKKSLTERILDSGVTQKELNFIRSDW